jgi:hypothetical protein
MILFRSLFDGIVLSHNQFAKDVFVLVFAVWYENVSHVFDLRMK